MTFTQLQWRARTRAIKRLLRGCNKWYWYHPNLATMRAQMLACQELTKHAQHRRTGFCLCSSVMYT
jgi:hypothetical protein